MLTSSLHTMLEPSKTTSPNKSFDYDCVTLYDVCTRFWSRLMQTKHFPITQHRKACPKFGHPALSDCALKTEFVTPLVMLRKKSPFGS